MIPVVSDVSVNPKLGSGAVKVTPAHSQADLEVAKKQNMEEMLSVINEEGNINLEGTLFHVRTAQSRTNVHIVVTKAFSRTFPGSRPATWLCRNYLAGVCSGGVEPIL